MGYFIIIIFFLIRQLQQEGGEISTLVSHIKNISHWILDPWFELPKFLLLSIDKEYHLFDFPLKKKKFMTKDQTFYSCAQLENINFVMIIYNIIPLSLSIYLFLMFEDIGYALKKAYKYSRWILKYLLYKMSNAIDTTYFTTKSL